MTGASLGTATWPSTESGTSGSGSGGSGSGSETETERRIWENLVQNLGSLFEHLGEDLNINLIQQQTLAEIVNYSSECRVSSRLEMSC